MPAESSLSKVLCHFWQLWATGNPTGTRKHLLTGSWGHSLVLASSLSLGQTASMMSSAGTT